MSHKLKINVLTTCWVLPVKFVFIRILIGHPHCPQSDNIVRQTTKTKLSGKHYLLGSGSGSLKQQQNNSMISWLSKSMQIKHVLSFLLLLLYICNHPDERNLLPKGEPQRSCTSIFSRVEGRHDHAPCYSCSMLCLNLEVCNLLSLKSKVTEPWLTETEGIFSSSRAFLVINSLVIIFGNLTLLLWPGLFSDFG